MFSSMRAAVLVVVWLSVLVGMVIAGEGYLQFPAIHGNTIVFSCEGDLWTVSTAGGLAKRLTHAEGLERLPRYSPDGRHIAFTGTYDKGGNDVYVIPAEGGEVKRLTYHPYSDWVLGWSPDGESVIFRSMRSSAHYNYRLFTIEVDGAFPEMMPLDKASLYSYSPDGRHMAFNRFSREFRTWKRYTGGLAQDIWIADLDNMDFRKITAYEGTDAFPMWVGDRIYFISDRSVTMNIFSMSPDGSDVRQHTFHEEYDVRWPSEGGGRIVYHHGGDVWLFDTAGGEYSRVDIDVPSDRVQTRPRFAEPHRNVTDFEISPKARRVAFCSRGNIALVPVEEGRLIELAADSGVRDKSPRWSPDGKSVAFISDRSGNEEIYVADIFSHEGPEQLTRNTLKWKYPAIWSPDGKKLAYADGTSTIYVVDRESGRVTAADSSDIWEIREYAWSPDSRYLAYAKPGTWEFSSIFVYDTREGEVIRVTDEFTDDTEPVWDPEGKYLYFLSDRTLNPVLSGRGFGVIMDKMTKPYLVMLQAGEKSPFFTREPEEVDEEENGNGDGEDGGKKGDSEEVTIKLDTDGLAMRIVEFPVEAGHYSNLTAAEGKVFYLSRPSLGMLDGQRRGPRSAIKNLVMFDLEDEEEKATLTGISDYRLSTDGKKVLYRRDRSYLVTGAGSEGGDDDDKVDISSWRMEVVPPAEWTQMFDEAWRLQRDFYWAPNMAGIDWEGVKARYRRLLPRIATRNELNDLIGQMIAELATSHTYIWGGDLGLPDRIPVGLLGVDVVPAPGGYYRIEKIYPPEPSTPGAESPLTLSHADVSEGEYIIAVNGETISTEDNFYSKFFNLAETEVLLTVNDRPSRNGTRDVLVETISDESGVRYLEWVRSNREYVARETDGRVGYIHIPNMGTRGLIEFWRTFYPQVQKSGLIVDARYNGGGFVSELVIERLSNKLLAYGKARKGKAYRYPEDAVDAHMVALCNQQAGSDGDIFTRAFKLADLGPVIGMRTWGGVVGIRMDKPFVDGGMMTIPEFAWWEPEGWTLENRGAEPDIEVENMPDQVLQGRDQQLDKALEVVTERLEQDPRRMPDLPPFPDKGRD
jgi:tricorn protease